jgi:serine/threonine protein kinase
VAVKQIQERFRGLDSSEYDRLQRRFLREARITARLQHPGIAPVYGLGKTETGVLHYAMRLLKGPSLDEVVKKHYDSATNSDEKSHHRGEQSRSTARRLEFRGLIQRVIDVCHTLQYAHDLNVVHRDIKPKNIVTGGYGETIIVDWGLAKLLAETKTDDEELLQKSTREMSDSTDLTQSGVALGTPGYMSPEQARGERQSVGPASDVYSVGATLYMVLTGHNPKPLNASTGTEADAVAEATPAPRSIRSEIPRPLEAICLKAMAIAPQDRYESVSRLASDLERWLADEPVTAYRERLPERMWRTMRRHRSWWILAALALCLVSLSAILSAVLIDGFRRTSVTQRRRTNEALSVLYEYMERTNRSKVRKAL